MKKAMLFLALAAAAVTVAGWWFYWPMYTTEQHVKLALNDPDSAMFQKVVFNRKTGAGCGYVNAKNRMGGYVGNTHFVATADGQVRFAPNVETESGTTQQRLDAISKKIDYLRFAQENCPEGS